MNKASDGFQNALSLIMLKPRESYDIGMYRIFPKLKFKPNIYFEQIGDL